MFIIDNYPLAVFLCFITMFCWGSWANTLKLAAKSWRYELFYWDTVISNLFFSFIIGISIGSFGSSGRPFFEDLAQADALLISSVILGGALCNVANILLSSAVTLVGLAVAFPLSLGLALILGVIINYIGLPKGDPILLFSGISLIFLAMICNAWAIGKKEKKNGTASLRKKGLLLALISGVLFSFFYRFVAIAMDTEHFESPAVGSLSPYSALFIFSIGSFLSNLIFNSLLMKYPLVGKPTSYKDYFQAKASTHLTGMLGGIILCIGTACSYIAAGKAGPAISYALGQGAPMVGAMWGIFAWKEFKGASKSVNFSLTLMFIFFIAGLTLVVLSGGN